jgi:cold-inducible RNA-binding protein
MSQKIYVGNLGFSISSDDLKTKFEQYGAVQSARVVTDRDTGRSKGFAFVEMSNSQEATDAISALNGTEYEGRRMTVNEAKPEAPKDRSRFMSSR